ncbi:MAG: M28 family peptidase [Gemmatimonadaceae bacterium]|nr:M28 family peptidase [Gemmatimonadaceae bacterium]
MNAVRRLVSALGVLCSMSGVACAQRAAGGTEVTRLMARLSALSADSMEGRRAGTPGAARARAWLVRELTAMGAKPVGASFEHFVKLPARSGSDTAGANVVARIPGTRSGGPVIVLSAHYDHLGVRNGEIYNGADDDASGCVALLTIGERLMKAPLEHDVILAFFDAEESGLIGSRAFVGSGPFTPEQIALNINLDMVARQDGKALWVVGTSHYPTLKPIAEAAVEGSPISVRFGHDTKDLKPGDDWTGSSDHAPFHAKGIPFLYLGVEDHPDYHKPGDDADKIDASFFRATVDYAFRLVRAADSRVATITRPAK